METKTKRRGRQLLKACVGLAAVSFIGCGSAQPVGNLAPPFPPCDDAGVGAVKPCAAGEICQNHYACVSLPDGG